MYFLTLTLFALLQHYNPAKEIFHLEVRSQRFVELCGNLKNCRFNDNRVKNSAYLKEIVRKRVVDRTNGQMDEWIWRVLLFGEIYDSHFPETDCILMTKMRLEIVTHIPEIELNDFSRRVWSWFSRKNQFLNSALSQLDKILVPRTIILLMVNRSDWGSDVIHLLRNYCIWNRLESYSKVQ